MSTPQLPSTSGSQQMLATQTSVLQPTGQQTPTVFVEEEEYYVRLIKTTCCTARQMMLKVYKEVCRQAGKPSNMPIDEFLGLSDNQLKKWDFNASQLKKLKDDVSENDYDITLLYQIIILMWANLSSNSVNDKLRQTLRAVKMFRNDLMHESFRISCSDFRNKTEELKRLLTELLLAARDVYNVDQDDVDRWITSMNDQLNNIRDNPLTSDDITSYNRCKLFTQLKTLLLTDGKPELLNMYEKWTYLNPVSFIEGSDIAFHVGNIFTRMDLKESGVSSKNKRIEYEQILQNIDKAACNLVSGIVLIEGPAGVGKTTLLRKILRDWQAGDNTMTGLTRYDLLLYMEVRNPNISSVVQLLQSLMPNTSKKYIDNDMVKCARDLRLLFLVDGLDEINESSDKLFREILPLSTTGNIHVICTTRPDYVKDFYKLLPQYLKPVHIELLGIPDESHTQLAATYHDELIKAGKSKESTSELTEYMQSAPRSLQDHLRLPLNLVLLTILWATSPSNVNGVTTATELYVRIRDMTKEKLLERLKNNRETQLTTSMFVERSIEYFFRDLCRESLQSLKDDSIILIKSVTDKLMASCLSAQLPPEEITSAFLIQKVTWTALGTESYLSFPHKGVQDFYSALCIMSSLHERNSSFDVAGVLSDNNDSLFKHQVPPLQSQDMVESVSDSLARRTAPVTILNVLEELHKDNPSSLTLRKYQNVLIHLAGLLHLEGKLAEDTIAKEVVTLLKHSGMTTRRQWVDLLNDVKCDMTVMKYVIMLVPEMVTGDIVIEDSSVAVYAALLPHCRPGSVEVTIRGNPEHIPRLLDLMRAMAKYTKCPVEIYLHYDFQHPRPRSTSLDKALQRVFQSCEVKVFVGQLSGAAVRTLADTLQYLCLGIPGDDPDLDPALRSLAPALSSPRHDAELFLLSVHVPSGVPLTLLPGPLPENCCIDLCLSGVEVGHTEWAAQVAQQLLPLDQVYWCLYFPGSQLSDQDLSVLAGRLIRHQVQVSSGDVWVTGEEGPVFSASGYTFRRMSDDDMWKVTTS